MRRQPAAGVLPLSTQYTVRVVLLHDPTSLQQPFHDEHYCPYLDTEIKFLSPELVFVIIMCY